MPHCVQHTQSVLSFAAVTDLFFALSLSTPISTPSLLLVLLRSLLLCLLLYPSSLCFFPLGLLKLLQYLHVVIFVMQRRRQCAIVLPIFPIASPPSSPSKLTHPARRFRSIVKCRISYLYKRAIRINAECATFLSISQSG